MGLEPLLTSIENLTLRLGRVFEEILQTSDGITHGHLGPSVSLLETSHAPHDRCRYSDLTIRKVPERDVIRRQNDDVDSNFEVDFEAHSSQADESCSWRLLNHCRLFLHPWKTCWLRQAPLLIHRPSRRRSAPFLIVQYGQVVET